MHIRRKPRPLAASLVTSEGEVRPRRPLPALVESGLDRGIERRRAAVERTLRRVVRGLPPDAGGADVVAAIERRFLMRASLTGAAAGAAAAAPGVGIVAGLAFSAADTAAFFSAGAFFVQSRLQLEVSPEDDPQRLRGLILTLLLGPGGSALLRQLGGELADDGPSRHEYRTSVVARAYRATGLWLPLLTGGWRGEGPDTGRAARAGGRALAGRLAPYGIGAVLGAASARGTARQVVLAARDLFDEEPAIPDRLRAQPGRRA
ncbi:MAG TPA: hypothetical protein VFQ96_06160 [Microbacteriaceae bacterium]|nr:hypothetical protein [Microbacteriaceae bacterium]